MYGLDGLNPAGRDWWSIGRDWYTKYLPHLEGVPGVAITTDFDGTPLLVRVHRTHLPLLPGYSSSAARQTPVDIPRRLWEWLRVYQQDAVMFCRERHGVLIADDLGLGKTATATAAAELPVMVLCPASALSVWEEECERMGWKFFTFKSGTAIADARGRYDDNIDCWITSYSMAPKLISEFHPAGAAPDLHTLIADEAHVMSRTSVKAHKAFAATSAQRRLVLTATPMRSRLASLWGVLHAANPTAWGSNWDFRKRYCGAVEGTFGLEDGEPTNTTELATRVKAILVKRTRAEVGHVVPPLKRFVHELEPDHQSIREAVEATKHTAQIAVESAMRQEIGRQKAEQMGETFSVLHQRYNRLVVWFWHKEILKAVASRFKEAGSGVPFDVMTGESPTKKRANILHEWKHGDPNSPRILFATIGAGATAISLTTAQAALFVEYDWIPLNVVQAEKRHHRFGNPHAELEAHYLVLRDTDDERMLNVLLEKADASEEILGRDGQVDLIETLLAKGRQTAKLDMGSIWERI